MIKLYNTLTRKIESFKPLKNKQLTMYVCGPTVYANIHIGNARPVIFFDVLRNYFEFLNYHVNYVSNITDIDDKIISEAKKEQISEMELTKKFTEKFIEATKNVGSRLPDIMPKATNYIDEMIEYINDLINNGYAYQTKSGVYFKTTKLKNYGILSKRKSDELEESVRIENKDDKLDFRDFSLWKITEEGLSYDSPFGHGRPGWHTECAVMNNSIFGGKIDIHGGGSDLIFPHHENEIAQTMAHSNHHLANYWLHVARLDLDNEKMSKSLGNTVLVKDLTNPIAFRLLTLAHHYRSPISYSDQLMAEYITLEDRIIRTFKRTAIKLFDNYDEEVIDEVIINDFKTVMNEDLNTAKAISLVLENIKVLNSSQDIKELNRLYNTLKLILKILGIKINIIINNDIINTHKNWISARENKDFKQADHLREKLLAGGWI